MKDGTIFVFVCYRRLKAKRKVLRKIYIGIVLKTEDLYRRQFNTDQHRQKLSRAFSCGFFARDPFLCDFVQCAQHIIAQYVN